MPESDEPHVATRRSFDIFGWLKAQMALMPLLALVGATAMIAADARYDDRYVKKVDGAEVQRSVDLVRASVAEIKTTQAVNAEQIKNISDTLGDLKESQTNISQKIDRLIERR